MPKLKKFNDIKGVKSKPDYASAIQAANKNQEMSNILASLGQNKNMNTATTIKAPPPSVSSAAATTIKAAPPSSAKLNSNVSSSKSFNKKNDMFDYLNKNQDKLKKPPPTKFKSAPPPRGKTKIKSKGGSSSGGGGGEGGPSFGGVNVGFGGIDKDYHPHINVGGLDIDLVREADDYFSGKPMSQHPGIEPMFRANGKEDWKALQMPGSGAQRKKYHMMHTKWNDPLTYREMNRKFFGQKHHPLSYTEIAAESKTRR